ncbi:MAG: hypothetical protein NT016_01725 [Candidatus Aenigmarchaeota archaeon]|nr:hypothetical protein [Candidatus Aenigmarchaeota archaeon]
MNLDNALDWGLGLGVLFMLAGAFVVPQFSSAIAAVADINDTGTKTIVTAAFGIAFVIAVLMVVKGAGSYSKN